MGYQEISDQIVSGEQPVETFTVHLRYPLVIVGPESPHQFLLNPAELKHLADLQLPEESWGVIEPALAAGV